MSPLRLALTLHAAGDASPDTAWARYVEFARWPGWSPQIVGVEADATRIAPGVRGRVRGPLGVPVDFVVETVDELARTWSWRAHLGPVGVWLWHSVEPRGDGCSTTLRVRGLPPVVLGYAPLARWALGRLVRA